jgi:ParB family protein of integrating conjugative element (PFGI_1 class)
VQAGGNTRLRILQALFAETGDPRFAHVHCLFRPWRRESDVLLAHLKENDLHGALSFIDKALAVADARRLLEAELGECTLSLRRLADLLKARGYGLSHGLLSQMGYAVETLLPAMPHALQAGLGRPQVERLRALDRAAGALWRHYRLGDETAFREIYSQLCKRHDGTDWDIAPLRAALESELAERAEASIHTVRAQLTACLAGQAIEVSATAGTSADALPVGVAPESAEPASMRDPGVRQGILGEAVVPLPTGREDDGVAEGVGLDRDDLDHGDKGDEADEADGSDEGGRGREKESETSDSILAANRSSEKNDLPRESRVRDGDRLPKDLKSLRARAWTLAARLAQRHGMGELVAPLPSRGLGFVLRDVPDPALADQLDDDTLSRLSLLWWHLAACAELTVAPVDAVLANLATDSVLRRALETEDAGLLFASVWTLDPGHAGFRLWRLLDARDWQDLLDLMATYRALHQVADATQTPLWA